MKIDRNIESIERNIQRDLLLGVIALMLLAWSTYFLDLVEAVAEWTSKPEIKSIDPIVVMHIFAVWLFGIFMLRRLYELRATDKKLFDEITERKEAEAHAQEASYLKSRFLANVSHEIRTPLNSIIGLSEVMLNSNSIETFHQHSRIVLQESEIMLKHINDILDHAKIDAGKMEIERLPFDLYCLLESIASSVRVKADSKGLEFRMSVGDNVPLYLMGDGLRLRQSLMNLVSNALKFTKHGSVIVSVELIECKEDHAMLHFAVTDTGIGISREKHELIFESFRQSDPGMTREYGGTGLGTAIVRELVGLMGGKVGLESEQEKGSTFWFDLSMEVCQGIPKESEMSLMSTGHHMHVEHETPHRTGHILIVDDYPPNQQVARHHLESQGYSVDVLKNGSEAVSICSKGKSFDLILMDVQMPVMDGYEATKQIRSGSLPVAKVPILGLTASADADVRRFCRDVGMNEVIIKPIRRKQFLASVHKWLSTVERAEPVEALVQAAPAGVKSEANSKAVPMEYEVAVQEFEGDREVLDSVLTQFLIEVEKQIGILCEALQNRDCETLWRESHKIKGGAGNLTAMPLSNAAGELERVGRSGNLSEARVLLAKLEREFERLQASSLVTAGV